MSRHMLGTQYEHAGAPDDGPCSSCEVVRLRAEVAALRDVVADYADQVGRANRAERDLATAREREGAWRRAAKDARDENERARALREIAGRRNCQLLEERDVARALLARWVARVEKMTERVATIEADTRAFLRDPRRDEACNCIPEGARLNWLHVRGCPKYREGAPDSVKYARDEAGVPPFTPTADSSATSPVYAARDEQEEILEDKCHKELGNVRPGKSARDEARRCTCVPHSGDCELRRDEARALDDAPKCTPGCARGETENIWHSQACRDARDEVP